MLTLRIAFLIMFLAVSGVAADVPLGSLYGGQTAATPLAMATKWVGGATTVDSARVVDFACRRDPVTHEPRWVWEAAGGPSTVGLLTRIWGTVTSVYHSPVTGAKWFYVDDGSRCVSDYGDIGVLVYGDADVKERQFVSVTGEAGVEQSFDSAGRLVRTLTTRSAGDVVVIRDLPPPPQYPFSDEFDGPTLDLRWAASGAAAIWLAWSPGELAITPPSYAMPAILQPVPGDWNAEVRVRLAGSGGSTYSDIAAGVTYDRKTAAYTAAIVRASSGAASVWVYGIPVRSFDGDTCWFRLRRRGPSLTVSYSINGSDYTGETTRTVFAYQPSLSLYVQNRDWTQCTGYFDYIRFTAPTP